MTKPAICRVEDADYEGHSLFVLKRIEEALLSVYKSVCAGAETNAKLQERLPASSQCQWVRPPIRPVCAIHCGALNSFDRVGNDNEWRRQ